MANAPRFHLHYTKLGKHKFFVEAEDELGSRRGVGTIARFYPSHIREFSWEATASNGDHHAVHDAAWKAAMALTVKPPSGANYSRILDRHRHLVLSETWANPKRP